MTKGREGGERGGLLHRMALISKRQCCSWFDTASSCCFLPSGIICKKLEKRIWLIEMQFFNGLWSKATSTEGSMQRAMQINRPSATHLLSTSQEPHPAHFSNCGNATVKAVRKRPPPCPPYLHPRPSNPTTEAFRGPGWAGSPRPAITRPPGTNYCLH